MPIPKPRSGERESEFMQRCMSDDKMISEYDNEQRAAICKSTYSEHLASEKVSFDYDGTLSTEKGFQRAQQFIEQGADVYIISARSDKSGMMARAEKLGINESNVYAMGSNEAKIQKIKELAITIHYDNNQDVINQLPNIGRQIN
jgi:Asp/Glu/hydantoin racemase